MVSLDGGDGEIRTRVGLLPNAFRVRPVMTTSIRLHKKQNSRKESFYF